VARGALKFLLFVVVLLAIVAGILKTFFVDIVTVGHDGMAPTMVAGDTVLVWRGAQAEHGDIMLCRHPTLDTRFVIGRVVGRNGTPITSDRAGLRIDGTNPPIEWRGDADFYDHGQHARVRMRWGIEQLGNDFHTVFLRDGRDFRMRPIGDYDGLYLLDDNRTYTGEDSREFGPVPEGRCIGQVFLRVGLSPESPPEVGNRAVQIIN
jgi:signal peptidase I